MPGIHGKPDRFRAGQQRLSAGALNKILDATNRQFIGGPSSNVEFYGDRMVVNSIPDEDFAPFRPPPVLASVLVEYDDYLLCTVVGQTKQFPIQYPMEYNQTLGTDELDDLKVYVAKPYALQRTPFEGKMVPVHTAGPADTAEEDAFVTYSFPGTNTTTASFPGAGVLAPPFPIDHALGLRVATNPDATLVVERITPCYFPGEIIRLILRNTGYLIPNPALAPAGTLYEGWPIMIWQDANEAGRTWLPEIAVPSSETNHYEFSGGTWDGNKDDYELPEHGTYFSVTGTGPINWTGIVKPDPEISRVVYFINNRDSVVTIKPGTTSSAGNQFYTISQTDLLWEPGEIVKARYDTVNNRWVVVPDGDSLNEVKKTIILNSGTTPGTVLNLDMVPPGSNGTRDSHIILQTGGSYDGSAHTINWRYYVDVTSNAGLSTYVWENRIDANSFVSKMTITSLGQLTVYTGDTVTNTSTQTLNLVHQTTGTATTNFGIYTSFTLQNGSGTNREAGRIDVKYTDATNTSEDAQITISVITGGSLTALFTGTSLLITLTSTEVVISNNLTINNLVQMQEIPTPGSPPAANTLFTYAKDIGGVTKLVYLRSDNTEVVLDTSAGATPGGSNMELQYNNAGAFGGIPDAEYDNVNETLIINNLDIFTVQTGGAGTMNLSMQTVNLGQTDGWLGVLGKSARQKGNLTGTLASATTVADLVGVIQSLVGILDDGSGFGFFTDGTS